MRRPLALLLLSAVACSDGAGQVALPDNYREQLHAVTGHEPEHCTDLRAAEAVIEITEAGFAPQCAIVSASQELSIVNSQDVDDTWIVADPPTDLEIPRHHRLIFEVAANSISVVDGLGERVGTGVWVCYGRESRHECQLVVVP